MEKNKLEVFNNEEFGSVRVLEFNDEPWFVGKDVAGVLGYSNINKAVQTHVDIRDKKTLDFKGFSQNGIVNKLWDGNDFSNKVLINESGLYSLILSSKLPSARKFQRWVTSEVLPSIRKHGAYMTKETMEKALQDPDYVIGLIQVIKDEREKNRALELKTQEQVVVIEEQTTRLEEQSDKIEKQLAEIKSFFRKIINKVLTFVARYITMINVVSYKSEVI